LTESPASLATVLSRTRSAVGFTSTTFALIACVAVIGLADAPEAVALNASETVESHPEYVKAQAVTPAGAISYLDQQREANGIPGGLVEEPRLSEGCEQYTNEYVLKAGQYPHTELPEQSGFTQAGLEAASQSELSPNKEAWSSTVNPWADAPLHLSGLFDPSATSAWYGERTGPFTVEKGENVCMGTGGTRSFASPTFFSLPGTGSSDVPASEVSAEEPYTPAEAVGLPVRATTGPTIILWPEDAAGATLSSATLVSSSGTPAPIKIATPQTPSPESPPGFPNVPTVGEYSNGASFVVPTRPLASDTTYVLSVVWQPATGPSLPQTVQFTTTKHYVGRLAFRTSGRRLIVSGSPVVGQAVTIEANWGVVVCVEPRKPCPNVAIKNEFNVVTKHVLQLTKASVSVTIPRPDPGDNVFVVLVTMHKFTAYGQRWESNTLTATSR
jgi:hypothetical protein